MSVSVGNYYFIRLSWTDWTLKEKGHVLYVFCNPYSLNKIQSTSYKPNKYFLEK